MHAQHIKTFFYLNTNDMLPITNSKSFHLSNCAGHKGSEGSYGGAYDSKSMAMGCTKI